MRNITKSEGSGVVAKIFLEKKRNYLTEGPLSDVLEIFPSFSEGLFFESYFV
jgi:hypothetical protein